MKYLYVLLVLMVVTVSGVSAQEVTPTPVAQSPTPVVDLNFNDLAGTTISQYPDDMDHLEVLADLGVTGDVQILPLLGEPLQLSDPRAAELEVSLQADYVVPRSSYTSCNSSVAVAATSFQSLQPRGSSLDYNGYINYCKNLSGPACAAAWQQKVYYAYTYNALGRGSYVSVPSVFFSGAPYGAATPPAVGNSTSPIWGVKLEYETGSLRYVSGTGVPPTVPPNGTPTGGKYYSFVGDIKIPETLGRTYDGTSYKFFPSISYNYVANYAMRIQVPSLLQDTLKPRLAVCAVRPYIYSPEYKATYSAQLTATANQKRTATALAQVTRVPSSPVPGGDSWDSQLSAMFKKGFEYYVQCSVDDLSRCYLSFYGAAGTSPTDIRSGLLVRVLEWSPTTGKVGKEVKRFNMVCPRGSWCKLSFSDLKRYDYTNYSNNKYLIGVSCGVAYKVVCPPFYDVAGDMTTTMHMFNTVDRWKSSPRSKETKIFVSPFRGAVSYLTATAYKNQKTATSTRVVYTAQPTFTRFPTVYLPATITLGPPPPTTGTGQTGATQTAIAKQRQTATAAAAYLQQTQTALAKTQTAISSKDQTATAAAATSYAQATRARLTATAATGATQTKAASITAVVHLTLTAIADDASTAVATVAPGVAATMTAEVIANDNCAVFCFNVDDQTAALELQAPSVGTGSVVSALTNVFVSFDRGIKSTPCNGLPESISGNATGSGDYNIRDELEYSLCYWRNWFDSNTTIFPVIRIVLSAVFVVLIGMIVLRVFRASVR